MSSILIEESQRGLYQLTQLLPEKLGDRTSSQKVQFVLGGLWNGTGKMKDAIGQ